MPGAQNLSAGGLRGLQWGMATPPPAPQANPRARLLRYLLWASEIALMLAVLYALAKRPPSQPTPAAPTPGAAASPTAR